MIEIYLLEQLDAFARCGTLSAASEDLHISQPALTRSMNKIEEELGVTLFERHKNRLYLNETGKLAAAETTMFCLRASFKGLSSWQPSTASPLRASRMFPCSSIPRSASGMTCAWRRSLTRIS